MNVVGKAGLVGAPDSDRVALLDRHAVAVEDDVVREGFDSLVLAGNLAGSGERPSEREAACAEDGGGDQERGDAVIDDPSPCLM